MEDKPTTKLSEVVKQSIESDSSFNKVDRVKKARLNEMDKKSKEQKSRLSEIDKDVKPFRNE